MNLDDLLREMRAEAAQGDHRAEFRFWAAADAELRRFFTRPSIEPADRDDLIQLSLTVVLQRLDNYVQTGPNTFVRWLRTIGSRVVLTWRRAPREQRAALSRLAREPSRSAPFKVESPVLLRELAALLAEVEPELPDNDRQILEHDLAEGDDETLARDLGITETAVSMRRRRARRRAKQRSRDSDSQTPRSE